MFRTRTPSIQVWPLALNTSLSDIVCRSFHHDVQISALYMIEIHIRVFVDITFIGTHPAIAKLQEG